MTHVPFPTDHRTVLRITGPDRNSFLNSLTTNHIPQVGEIKYSALLTPQGKFIADFFMVGQDNELWVDVQTSHAPQLAQRLNMYRLRADVHIEDSAIKVSTGLSDTPDAAFFDPRHPQMGWRNYGPKDQSQAVEWDALRVAYLIGKTGVELTPDTYILEAGFERLNGVDFKKGCYVGQEIVARMKHKTTLRKGLRRVQINGSAVIGDAIDSLGKPSGTLHTCHKKDAIAFLRFDRLSELKTAASKLTLIEN